VALCGADETFWVDATAAASFNKTMSSIHFVNENGSTWEQNGKENQGHPRSNGTMITYAEINFQVCFYVGLSICKTANFFMSKLFRKKLLRAVV
jgi:hypothetical protein